MSPQENDQRAEVKEITGYRKVMDCDTIILNTASIKEPRNSN